MSVTGRLFLRKAGIDTNCDCVPNLELKAEFEDGHGIYICSKCGTTWIAQRSSTEKKVRT